MEEPDDGPPAMEVDWNDPMFAPMAHDDPRTNRRRMTREELDEMAVPRLQPPQQRRASDEEVRRMQFETARRIIFGSNQPPNLQGRERHTSASTVDYDRISFLTPFPLGNVKLMLTQGLDNLEGNIRDPDYLAKRSVGTAAVVWMEMPGPLHTWDTHDVMQPQNVPIEHGLMVAGSWVCIGILRVDHFIPMMPNFMHVLGIQFIKERDRGENNYVRFPQITSIEYGQVKIQAEEDVKGVYETAYDADAVRAEYDLDREDEDSDEWEERLDQLVEDHNVFHLLQGVDIKWEQMIPGQRREPSVILDKILKLKADDQDTDIDDIQRNGDHMLDNGSPGRFDIQIQRHGESALLTYEAPVPFHAVRRIFAESAPLDFVARLLKATGTVEDTDPCTFFFPTRNATVPGLARVHSPTRIETTAWCWSDIALVCYAQSYLMHVLTGPDPRHFFADDADKSPMKETQEPRPRFVIRPDPDADNVLELCVAGPNPVPFQSFETSMYFFIPSLAYRAARVLDVAEATRVRNLGPVYGAALAGDFMFGRVDPHLFFAVMNMIHARKERMEQYEFLGCHVCLTRPATFKAAKVGLQVCSELCYSNLKQRK